MCYHFNSKGDNLTNYRFQTGFTSISVSILVYKSCVLIDAVTVKHAEYLILNRQLHNKTNADLSFLGQYIDIILLQLKTYLLSWNFINRDGKGRTLALDFALIYFSDISQNTFNNLKSCLEKVVCFVIFANILSQNGLYKI